MSYLHGTGFTKRFGLCLGLSLSPLCLALESDQHQPIKIRADTAVLEEAKGIAIYTGQVKIRQGSLSVSADRVEVRSAAGEVLQIIATANKASKEQAHYEQQKNTQGDMVVARAERITYLVQENRLHLSGKASLQQAQDTFSGEFLIYEPGASVILDSGAGAEDRVKMTISPKTSAKKPGP